MLKQGIQALGMLEIRVAVLAEGEETATLDMEAPPAYTLIAPAEEGYILGRSDSNSSYEPDIDLMAQGAQERGVSRRHAALVRHRGLVHVVDLDSVNGTFLNGKRLSPHIPYPLNAGDRLSLANLEITISHGDDSAKNTRQLARP
jgi:pSer/pThr/pTyr-binding forkhead associated (FHA) protein